MVLMTHRSTKMSTFEFFSTLLSALWLLIWTSRCIYCILQTNTHFIYFGIARWTFLMTSKHTFMSTLQSSTTCFFTIWEFSSTLKWRLKFLLSTTTWNWMINVNFAWLAYTDMAQHITLMLPTRKSFIAKLCTQMWPFSIYFGATKFFAFMFLTWFYFITNCLTFPNVFGFKTFYFPCFLPTFAELKGWFCTRRTRAMVALVKTAVFTTY